MERGQFRGFASEARRLTCDIKTLRQEASELNTPETFVRYAKANRLVSQKEKHVQVLGAAMRDIYQCKTMTRLLFLSKAISLLANL